MTTLIMAPASSIIKAWKQHHLVHWVVQQTLKLGKNEQVLTLFTLRLLDHWKSLKAPFFPQQQQKLQSAWKSNSVLQPKLWATAAWVLLNLKETGFVLLLKSQKKIETAFTWLTNNTRHSNNKPLQGDISPTPSNECYRSASVHCVMSVTIGLYIWNQQWRDSNCRDTQSIAR